MDVHSTLDLYTAYKHNSPSCKGMEINTCLNPQEIIIFRTHTHRHRQTHTHTHARTHKHIHTHIYVCVCFCVRVCVYIYVCGKALVIIESFIYPTDAQLD